LPLGPVSHALAAERTSSSTSDVTNLFFPPSSKQTSVRPPPEEATTPRPKLSWLTRWPSASARPEPSATGSGTGKSGSRGLLGGRGRGTEDGLGGEEADEGRRFGTFRCASR
jgi:hypothetical protein